MRSFSTNAARAALALWLALVCVLFVATVAAQPQGGTNNAPTELRLGGALIKTHADGSITLTARDGKSLTFTARDALPPTPYV